MIYIRYMALSGKICLSFFPSCSPFSSSINISWQASLVVLNSLKILIVCKALCVFQIWMIDLLGRMLPTPTPVSTLNIMTLRLACKVSAKESDFLLGVLFYIRIFFFSSFADLNILYLCGHFNCNMSWCRILLVYLVWFPLIPGLGFPFPSSC